MATLRTITGTNSLIYKADKIVNDKHIFVTIRLDDQCKNGHQDFSVTGAVYIANKPKNDHNCLTMGCCHDEILAAFPEFKMFIDLHLCDYLGNPMYAVSNMHYHMSTGFNKTKTDSPEFITEYCNYYHITNAQFLTLQTAQNELQFYNLMIALHIPKQWKKDADMAIKELERLTGNKFLIDSKRTQLNAPSNEELKEEEERQDNGYYTPEAEAARIQADINNIMKELEVERDKDIKKATDEYEVKKQVLLAGGKKSLKNCIFYTHTNTLAFNWNSFDVLTDTEVANIITAMKIPEGVTVENKKKG